MRNCSVSYSQVGCEALAKYDHTKTLNLDVSTMLAYISSLTNGGCFFKFEESILTEQAACERRNPVKVILDSLFAGNSDLSLF